MRRSGKRPYGAAHRPLDMVAARGGTRTERGPGGRSYTVRGVRGEKVYTCPGCNRQIAVGTDHVVVWLADWLFGDSDAVQGRRHWHSSCWGRARG